MARIKMRKRKYLPILLICLLTVVAGVVVYGKYYATRNNKGVVSASNIYFDSDKLRKVTGITDIDAIAGNDDLLSKITVFTNSDSWAGGNLSLPFDVRNFQNNILVNDDNLDIKYKIEFVLLDDPIGAKYYVVDNQNMEHNLAAKGDKFATENTLKGGNRVSDSFSVKVVTDATDVFQAARVLVVAYPIEPDYIFRDTTADHEYRLIGIFKGHITEMEMSIGNKKFRVQTTYQDHLSSWKQDVLDLSGYIYNIKTIGDIISENQTTSKKQVKVTWNSKYLTLDNYDDYYVAALAHDDNILNDADPANDGDVYLSENTVDGVTYKSMLIDVLPYNSIDMTFYKTLEFNTEIAKTSTTRQWFEGLVDAELN